MGEKGKGASASLADKGGETCARTNEARSAACAVEIAGGRVVLGGEEPDLFGMKGDGAVFFHEAGDADPAVSLHGVESGVRVAQFQEGLEVQDVRTEIDDFEPWVVLNLLFHRHAVGAGGHAIDFDHDVFF